MSIYHILCPLFNLFFCAYRCQDEGFAEGKIVGRTRGLEAGYRLGCVKGGEIGSEVSYSK